MAEPGYKTAAAAQPVTLQGAGGVILASAKEALGSAFLLWVMGGVAISLVGAFAGDMIPSLPPGFGGPPTSDARHSGLPQDWWRAARVSAFGIFFAIFFIHSLWVGFRDEGRGIEGRIGRIASNLRQHWFGLLVGNAISAWIAVLVLGIMQNISLWQFAWRVVWGMILPVVQEIGRIVFGAPGAGILGAWFSWYEANQLKLTFWVIYLGGAFDDLGVPNFKTLARWWWRRLRQRKESALPSPIRRQDTI
jgi:hypothetical protein